MNKLKIAIAIAVLNFCIGIPVGYATPIQDVQNGILMGATGVDVNGMLYNVKFEGGTCNALFNNCDPASFAFTTAADATAASQALLDYVLVNTAAGTFGDTPNLTNGCTSSSYCDVMTPYAVYLSPQVGIIAQIMAAENFPGQINDNVYATEFRATLDTANWASTYAVWARQQTVPEPATLASIGIGLVAMGAVRRRRKQSRILGSE